ncbi:type III-A CRISPR-associated RAMP protein Csm4 [Thermosyntropha sp.]|uniref:type III-A CRISPR-associated RAMP protein Csm4 n=1 Tax=Thermosyntropha sp. TaxID=2740820 RepID=UPI0025EA78F9|nr:type III-A CRISPR-associated RAMP protein Csm4 [Thermosyntropha sp.]MBO8159673.1 type III-A CRISPR-associated RAMP protein Csm4 [Thermosyntropha sp.]
MFYCFFKLKFTTPVHFGSDIPGLGLERAEMTCHSDTLFSALCCEAFSLFGNEGVDFLVKSAQKGELLLSDLMPYKKDTLYIPRPLLSEGAGGRDLKNRKKIKKLTYIPICGLYDYLDYITGKRANFPEGDIWEAEFGARNLRVRVALNGQEKPRPYYVGTFQFAPDSGLYFILGIKEEEQLDLYRKLIISLGYSGLGGKRTSGFGHFEMEDSEYILEPDCIIDDNNDGLLTDLLLNQKASFYLSLSLVYPKKDELPIVNDSRATYNLVRREGFVQSVDYNNDFFVKRRPLIMLDSGSTFKSRIEGDIVDVSIEGKHPVYRYGKSMMLGVDYRA